MRKCRQTQCETGFAMVTAIILIVVLAALGVGIVAVSTTEQIGSAMDVQGARAYQAARSGIEWGAYQVWSSNSIDGRSGASCPSSATFPLWASFTPTAPTLSAFTITVTCTKATDPSNLGGPTLFTITSIACNMPNSGSCPGAASSIGGLNYVERRVTLTL